MKTFFIIGCTMSGVSSIVHNYRKLKNETRVIIKGDTNKLDLIKDSSIHKFKTKFSLNNIDLLLDESKKYDSKFIFIYRKNIFEQSLAWYDHHVTKDTLDCTYLNDWIQSMKDHESEVYNAYNTKVDLGVISYEDIYIDNYNNMIDKLKMLDLDLDYDTAKLFRYTYAKSNKLDGKYDFKPEINIHKDKPGFDICYDMLRDERIEFQ